jgi:hypothetical protein
MLSWSAFIRTPSSVQSASLRTIGQFCLNASRRPL